MKSLNKWLCNKFGHKDKDKFGGYTIYCERCGEKLRVGMAEAAEFRAEQEFMHQLKVKDRKRKKRKKKK